MPDMLCSAYTGIACSQLPYGVTLSVILKLPLDAPSHNRNIEPLTEAQKAAIHQIIDITSIAVIWIDEISLPGPIAI